MLGQFRPVEIQASEKNFKAHLEFHLFEHGTRPDGQPGRPGNPWTKEEFAVAVVKERRNGKSADARRNLDNWLRGTICRDQPWGLPVENALFGKIGQNRAYDEWRVLFRAARRANPQEGHRSELYVLKAIEDSVRDDLLHRVQQEGAERGWRLDRFEKVAGWTNPSFNLHLIAAPPAIKLRVLPGAWAAREHHHGDLAVFALTKARERGGDLKPGRKIRLAANLSRNRMLQSKRPITTAP